MARNEDGEYELTLGNTQLLSIFAILVVLLGIFFAMGYMVGRSGATQTASAPASKEGKATADIGPAPVKSFPEPETASSGTPAAAAPEESKPEPAAPRKPAPSRTKETPETRGVPAGGAILHVTQPESGETFLQVVATTSSDAETVAVALGKDNLHVRLAPAPNGLIRVLVGPTKDAADVARLRSTLEGKGFHPIVRKY